MLVSGSLKLKCKVCKMADEYPLKVLRPLTPQALLLPKNGELLKHLLASIDDDPLSDPLEDLLAQVYAGEVTVWTWGRGVLVTSFQFFKKGRVLLVTNLRGEGFLEQLLLIDDDIVQIAKAHGATFIKGEVTRPGLVREYVKRGGRASTFVLREVPK